MSVSHDISEAMIKSYSSASAAQAAAPAPVMRTFLDRAAGDPRAPEARAIAATSADYWGAFSVEKFAAASDLWYTHEDAQGWLDYLRQFQEPNFWYRDPGVGVWAYYEQYDNWQDTYGFDAVMAAYHSGHGGMDSNGVFYAAMGSNWGGLGTNAISTNMALGNEQVRYLFWSTCYSLRVLGSNNPIRTWYKPNLGFRMLFGFETTSVDASNYGRDFWKQWNRGKSFSQAWLDMSWYDVSHNQAPSVCACRASAAEAADRLFNERLFNWPAVSRDYWHWRWYYAAGSALAARALNQRVPRRIGVAQLAPESANGRTVRGILNRVPVGVTLPDEVAATPAGIVVLADGDRRLSVDPNGGYDAQLRTPNRDASNELQLGAAIRKAQDVVRQYGLDRNDVTFDRVFHKYDCAGTTRGSGDIAAPRITETVVQFTQLIDGVPVISPGDGKVSVTLDNDQNVTAVVDRTRPVGKLMEAMMVPAPDSARGGIPVPASELESDPERILTDAWQDRMKSWVVRGRIPERYSVVPGSYEVGYSIRGDSAQVVARQEIEADCGGGFLKRFVVEAPIRG